MLCKLKLYTGVVLLVATISIAKINQKHNELATPPPAIAAETTKKPSAAQPKKETVKSEPTTKKLTEVEKARMLLKRQFPMLSSRGGYASSGSLARKVFDQEKIAGVGPTSEVLWNYNKNKGAKIKKTIYTTYHKKFNNRYCASGVQYLHYSGYRVASNKIPLGTRVLLRYKNKNSYRYCVVIIADTGGLPLDGKNSAIQIDCSDKVAKDLGFYYNNNRYGEAIILPNISKK